MITTKSGIVIRMPVSDIRVMGRATQGVRVIRLDGEDAIADVAVVPHEDEEEVVGSVPEAGLEEQNSDTQPETTPEV